MFGILQDKVNWGRWGAEDERGAANLVTPEKVLRALQLPRKGQVLQLAIPIRRDNVPVLGHRNPPLHFMTRDGGDFAAGRVARFHNQSADDYIVVGCHGTTHVDALSHCWYSEELYNGFAQGVVRSDGARKLGIEKLGPIITRGVLLDFCALKETDVLPESYEITREDVDAALARQGVSVESGDCVLIRTGWLDMFWREPGRFKRPEPGLGLRAAIHLADMGVAFIGADNYGVEVGPSDPAGGGMASPVHGEMIRNRGIYLMELFDLAELARTGVSEFLFCMVPLQIEGGVGSPITPVAII